MAANTAAVPRYAHTQGHAGDTEPITSKGVTAVPPGAAEPLPQPQREAETSRCASLAEAVMPA